ncbi:MAG: pyridoxal-phosphate dependent enzyme, partial [bacterium]|nr:pyridoxal-phosphate dependent enzyme [bacterium]
IKMSNISQVDQAAHGIWKYHKLFPEVPKEFWLSLNEGNTPVVEKEGIFFKREDQNPTGSLKDRGLSYQISKAHSLGKQDLVISSSGNAAISAASYCNLAGIKLHVFVSPKIKEGKVKEIAKSGAQIHKGLRPVSSAIRYAKENDFLNLRPSVGDEGWVGYQTISFELNQELGKIDNIFIPVSSGTALVGINKGFEKIGYLPQVHFVQTTAVCPIASLFDHSFESSNSSIADALIAKAVPRKDEIVEIVKKSGGFGWVVSDLEIESAGKKLDSWQISTSAEGAAALAGIYKAKENGKNLGEKIVCLLTGKNYGF